MSELNWGGFPGEATASHGKYEIEHRMDCATVFYQPIGGKRSAIAEARDFSIQGAILKARSAGDSHHRTAGVLEDKP